MSHSYSHFNTPISHDWCFGPQWLIAAPPVLRQNTEAGCNLNYAHYHAVETFAANSAIDQPWANSLVHNTFDLVPTGIRESLPPGYTMRWRSMPWPAEIYPPIQGPRPPNNGYTEDPSVDETQEMLERDVVPDGTHISTIARRLAPLYYPRAFFHTVGLHNINFVLLCLQHLEAMAPRAEALDENGQEEKGGHDLDEKTEYQIPSPPWLGDPTPWRLPVLPTGDVPMELDPRPAEETGDRKCLKIRIDLKRLLPTRDVPMELDPLPTKETSKDKECLKIRIDRGRLKVLCKEEKAPY